MKRILILTLLITACISGYAITEKDAFIIDNIKEEMEFSLKKLEMDEYGSPFFIEYRFVHSDRYSLSSSYGVLESERESSNNSISANVKYGDYKFNGSGSGGSYFYYTSNTGEEYDEFERNPIVFKTHLWIGSGLSANATEHP